MNITPAAMTLRFVDSGTEVVVDVSLDKSGDGLDESGYGVDADDNTARVLFGTAACEEYNDLYDVDVNVLAEHQRVIISALGDTKPWCPAAHRRHRGAGQGSPYSR